MKFACHSFFRCSFGAPHQGQCSPLRLTVTSLLEPEVEDGRQLTTRAPPKDPNHREENRMSKPLLGGSAAAVALLSASMLFYAQPSVAETLAVASQEIQQKTAAAETKAPGADATTTTEVAEVGDAFKESETLSTAGRVTLPPAIDKTEE